MTTAPDQLTAEMWLQVLHQHEIPAVINPGDISSFLGVSVLPCLLLVASDYLKQAQEILADLKPEAEPESTPE